MKRLLVFIQRHFRPKLQSILGHTHAVFVADYGYRTVQGLKFEFKKNWENPSFNCFPQGEFIHFGDRILHCSVLTSVCCRSSQTRSLPFIISAVRVFYGFLFSYLHGHAGSFLTQLALMARGSLLVLLWAEHYYISATVCQNFPLYMCRN